MMVLVAADPRDFTAARWLAVVAAVVVVGAGIAMIARGGGRSADDRLPDADTAAPTPADCNSVPENSYDGNNTVFTISPNFSPIDVVVSVDRTRVCSGGSLEVHVTLTNRIGRPQELDDPALILVGNGEFVLHADLPAVRLRPNERRVLITAVTIPMVEPGHAEIRLDGFSAAAGFTIEGPVLPVCAAGRCSPASPTASS
jgi:hypothetical protein